MKKLLILGLFYLLSACQLASDPNTLRIGTIAGPETELVQAAKKVAQEKYGLNIKIIEFNDYNLPNEALEDGSLDANIYQHQPYLDAAIAAKKYHLKPLAKTFIFPTGLYSLKHQTLQSLPEKAIIAIPNDPSNEARALTLLAKANLIGLKNNTKTPGLNDIIQNRKHFRFKSLDAAQLPRVLPDVDAAIINTNYAVLASLNPIKDALLTETIDSPYANLIVISKNTTKEQQLQQFVKAFQSPEVIEKAKSLFGGAAVPTW